MWTASPSIRALTPRPVMLVPAPALSRGVPRHAEDQDGRTVASAVAVNMHGPQGGLQAGHDIDGEESQEEHRAQEGGLGVLMGLRQQFLDHQIQ